MKLLDQVRDAIREKTYSIRTGLTMIGKKDDNAVFCDLHGDITKVGVNYILCLGHLVKILFRLSVLCALRGVRLLFSQELICL